MDVLAAKSMIETATSCDFDEYIKTYSGIATFFRAKHTRDLAETDIALVGLPMDAGLTQRTGARHGPREVRSQSCNVLYFNPLTSISPMSLCRVRDIGDVPIPSAFDLGRMIDEIFAFYRRLHAADVVPLTVGGDHSITFPILGEGPVYISFDIDGLDPAFAPGTGTPAVGGLTSYEAKRFLQGLRGLDFVGGDVVEVSPPFDSAGITALAGAQMLFEILCLNAEAWAKRARINA